MFAAISALIVSQGAAPAQSASGIPGAPFQHFNIARFNAVALKDGDLKEPVDGKSFVLDKPNETVGKILDAGGVPADHFEFSIQPLLVHANDYVLLFDTGAGNFFGDIAGKLPESMTAAGELSTSVTDIFISHAHGDHIGGLITATGALAFPQCEDSHSAHR